jgi:Cytochrome c554 and c-prime
VIPWKLPRRNFQEIRVFLLKIVKARETTMNSFKVKTRIRGAAVGLAVAVALLAAVSSTAQRGAPQWKLGQAAPNQGAYVGQGECARCHAEIVERYAQSGMARALTPASACETLHAHAPLEFTRHGFHYRIEKQGMAFSYTVSRGDERLTLPLDWCFGHGASGHTFLVQFEGVVYETRVSYFTNLARLDLTPGAPDDAPDSLKSGVGQPQRPVEALRCFACHSTPAPGARAITHEQFTPGLQCEACHGPGGAHLAALKTGSAGRVAGSIFNPARWSPDEVNQQFCGACHRSWEAVMQMPGRGGPANVRFQPYRLANSRCYRDPFDRRIGCIACHDPHGAPVREAAAYDTRCLACHQGGAVPAKKDRTAPRCRARRQQNCVTCHMPKIEPEGLHFPFTDHWIRIVKTGERPPR